MTDFEGMLHLCEICKKDFPGCNGNPKFLEDSPKFKGKKIPDEYMHLVYDCDGMEPIG